MAPLCFLVGRIGASPSLFHLHDSLSAGEGVGGNRLKEKEEREEALCLACPRGE